MSEQVVSSEWAVPKRDGYDWLLNKCVDLDQAEHAEHLDSGRHVQACFHCQISEGRPRRPAPVVARPAPQTEGDRDR